MEKNREIKINDAGDRNKFYKTIVKENYKEK